MNEVGRPTDLTEDLTLEIRKLVLQAKSYKEIQETVGITDSVWDRWVWLNYKDFRTTLNNWKKERLIKKAEINLDVLMDAEDDKIKLDASKFTLETLGKEHYSKRNEMTGKDGEDIKLGVIVLPQKNDN